MTTDDLAARGGDDDPESDAAYLERTRAGDVEAYAELFRRHYPTAMAVASRRAGPEVAGDLVASAFERILRLLREGKGPRNAFRPYLTAAVTNAWVDRVRADSRLVLLDDDADLEPLVVPDADGADRRVEATLVTSAFASLPPRWQHVLWYTSVEQLPHAEVGDLLGVRPNAVAVLAHRAREGLRQAYLDAHLGRVSASSCRRTAPLLAAYVRGELARSKSARVDEHLPTCRDCTEAASYLREISAGLGALLLPVVLGARPFLATPPGTAPPPATASATPPVTPAATRSGRSVALVVAAAVLLVAGLTGTALLLRSHAGGDDDTAGPDAAPTRTGQPTSPPSVSPVPATDPGTTDGAPGSGLPAATPGAALATPGSTPVDDPVVAPPAPLGGGDLGGLPPSGARPDPPAVIPGPNPRLVADWARTSVSPRGEGWTRFVVPVRDLSDGSVLTAVVRGGQEVCAATGPTGQVECSTQETARWSGVVVDDGGLVTLDVAHFSTAWVQVGLDAPDTPTDDPDDNTLDTILR